MPEHAPATPASPSNQSRLLVRYRLLCKDHTEEETHFMVRRGRFRVERSVRLSNVTQARWFFLNVH